MSKKIKIDRVEFSNDFYENSYKFGYDQDAVDSYDDDLLDLTEIWEKQGFIEIYDPTFHGNFAAYPLLKDSNSTLGSSPYYVGLYHARLLSDSSPDPLVIVTFQGKKVDNDSYDKAVLEAMIYHDLMFLPKGKKDPQNMKTQKKWVSGVIDKNK